MFRKKKEQIKYPRIVCWANGKHAIEVGRQQFYRGKDNRGWILLSDDVLQDEFLYNNYKEAADVLHTICLVMNRKECE